MSTHYTPRPPGGEPANGFVFSPVFTKSYELIRWLIPHTLKFPRQQRFVAAAALQQGAQTVLQRLLEAQRSQSPAARLLHADVALAQLRLNWRLAFEWQLITEKQFEHGAKLMDEVGKLLGAWLKNARAR
jgi:23S rRNA-intervening sequence protein